MADSKYAKDQENRALAKPKDKVDALRLFMAQRSDELRRIMPVQYKFDVGRVSRLAVAAYAKNDRLLECSPASVFMAIHEACALGLDPVTPSLGHAYLVPFGKEATFMLGYKGMMELAQRSGHLSRTYAGLVYKDELPEFECNPPLGQISHPWRPGVNRADDEIVAAYALVYLKGESVPIIRILDRSEIEARRKRSQMGRRDSGPWKTDYGPMARKSSLRALYMMGVVPLSSDAMTAFHNDAVRDGVLDEEIVPIDAKVTETEVDETPPESVVLDDGNTVFKDMVSEEEWERLTKGEG